MTKTATRPTDVLVIDEDTRLATRITLERMGFKFPLREDRETDQVIRLEKKAHYPVKEWDQVAHLEALLEARHWRH